MHRCKVPTDSPGFERKRLISTFSEVPGRLKLRDRFAIVQTVHTQPEFVALRPEFSSLAGARVGR